MILAVNWANTLSVVVIGFGLVFIVLVLLIYILKLFGYFAAKESGSKKEVVESKVEKSKTDEKGITDGECAAIAMALSLFYADVHDTESYVITFEDNNSTSWNSKNLGLNNY